MKPDLLTACLTVLVQSSLLVTAAWFLLLTQQKTSAARRSSACRWTMAAVLTLTAVSLSSTARALLPETKRERVSAALPQGVEAPAETSLLPPPDGPPVQLLPASPTTLKLDSASTGPLRLSADSARWVVTVWLAGAACVLIAWIRSLAARRRLFGRSEDATGVPWLLRARDVNDWALVDQFRLIPQDVTPCVWGVIRTVVILPASAESWPAAKLHLVLAHEFAHLRRRDPLWQTISRFFLAMLWFHPLAWSLVRRSQAADEQAADDAVLRTQSDSVPYANLLVECARQFSLPPALQTTTSAMASPTTLTRRVEAVLNPTADRRPVNSASLLTGSVVISLLAVISTYAAPEISTTPRPETNPELVTKDDAPVLPTPTPTPTPTETPQPDVAKLEIPAGPIQLPSEKATGRKILVLAGSAKAGGTHCTISADEITLKTISGQSPPTAMNTIDPTTLESATITGSVTLDGKIDGVELSAKADSVIYSRIPPDQGLLLTGWPRLQSRGNLIESLAQDSRIIIGSKGINRVINCKITAELERDQPATAAPAVTEKPIVSPDAKPSSRSPFSWNPTSLNGLEYLPGWQLKEFYRFPTLSTTEPGKNFQLRSNTMIVKGTMGTNEILVNNVRFLLKHPVLDAAGMPMISRQDLSRILDPVIRPSASDRFNELAMVVIDPGHGGKETGASGPQGNGAVYALDSATRLQRILEEMGIKAILTGNDGGLMTLKERSDFAASHPKAIFIRLHFRSGPPEGQVIQTFFPDEDSARADRPENPGGFDFFTASVRLATAVHANCLYKLRGTDGGIRAAEYSTISSQFKSPAILIECGYPSHPDEITRTATEAYRQALAEAVAGGVQNFFRAIRKESIVPKRP